MQKKNITAARLGFAALILAVLTAIFLFTSQSSSDSNQLSRGLLKALLSRFGFEASAGELQLANLTIRKIAHFTLYFLLGVGAYGAARLSPLKPGIRFAAAAVFCALAASADELRQHLSGVRNGNAADVLLDIFGALCGALLLKYLGRIILKKRAAESSE